MQVVTLPRASIDVGVQSSAAKSQPRTQLALAVRALPKLSWAVVCPRTTTKIG